MGWGWSILVGLVNAALCTAVGAFAADRGTQWHGVSNMEGGRGMFIVFVFMPLAFVGGLAIGLWVARHREVSDFVGGLARLGLAAAVSLGLIAVLTGFAWITADHPPTIDDRELDLVFEVRLPADYPVPADSLRDHDFRVSVVVSNSDRAYAQLELDSVRVDADRTIVPGHSFLRSRGIRTVAVTTGNTTSSRQSLDLPLAPSPKAADLEWTDWMPLRPGGPDPPGFGTIEVRYRVRQY
ncbi:MAG: hypothetical protein AB7L66_22090 [Gemmatimonadales bacterium]